MSALYKRAAAIFASTGVDLSAALGKLVTFSAGVPAVSASATVPATGIVIEAEVAAKQSSLGVIGALSGTVLAKLSASTAAVAQGDKLQQAADGTLTKETTGARVTVAVVVDPNGGVAGDLVEVALITPVIGA